MTGCTKWRLLIPSHHNIDVVYSILELKAQQCLLWSGEDYLKQPPLPLRSAVLVQRNNSRHLRVATVAAEAAVQAAAAAAAAKIVFSAQFT